MTSTSGQGQEAPDPPSLLDLPDGVVLHILSFAPPQPLLSFSAASSRCLALARDPALWRLALARDFGVFLSAVRLSSSLAVYETLHERLRRGEPQLLLLAAACCDGGVDGGPAYSPEYLFSSSDAEVYCSAAGADVHVLALLAPSDAARRAADEAQQRREYLLERCRLPGSLVFREPHRRRATPDEAGFHTDSALERWSTRHLHSFFLQLYELLIEGHALGHCLFAGLSTAEVAVELPRVHALADSLRAELAALQAAGEQAALPQVSWMEPPPPLPVGHAAIVARIDVSRVGQFTCPLAAGAVFVASVGGGRGSEREALQAQLAGGRALDGATSAEAVVELVRAGKLPRIAAQGECLAGAYIIFEPRRAALDAAAAPWPAAWFRFRTRTSAAELVANEPDAAAAFAADEDAFDKLTLPLGEASLYHCGNCVQVALIAPENLMAEWGDDHGEPNIDVAGVRLYGAVVQT